MDSLQEQQQRQARLVTALGNARYYPHAVQRVEVIETHISIVLLAGDFAYKIKKPLYLGFLDFSSAQRRKFFCEEELRLNSRLAPSIYLGVVTFTASPDAPLMRDHGEGFEYAVKMRRFGQSSLFSAMHAAGTLDAPHIVALARKVAEFHAGGAARSSRHSDYGSFGRVLAPMLENFSQLATTHLAAALHEQLALLAQWTRRACHRLREVIDTRHGDGSIRECHGDLHLANIAWIGGQVVIFDGIEFSPHLRWIDTASEIAFAVMDLEHHGEQPLANLLLDHYLEHTGDYEALRLLDLYKVYRALVRAKIVAIRADQANADAGAGARDVERLVALAARYAEPRTPALYLTHGLSGSGKSYVAERLLQRYGLIRLRSDLVRKSLHGLAAGAGSASPPGGGIYTEAATERTYARLAEFARICLSAGYPVIVDATFLRRSHRQRFLGLAAELGLAPTILDVRASEEDIRARLAERDRDPRSVSEAGWEIYQHQLQVHEPLDEREQALSLVIENRHGAEPELPAPPPP